MFDFWYNKMTKNCPCTFELGMSDTDSFLFQVDKPDLFWEHMRPHMDYSNYPKDHPDYNEDNKAQLGYFKNEIAGKKCLEFIGLRPKCYCLNIIDKKTNEISEKKVCKGVGRSAIKNRLRFKQYQKCLFEGKSQRHEFASIRSTKHKIATIRQKKLALTCFDSKRYYFCSIHSVPFGSKRIKSYIDKCPFCKS